MDEYRCKYSWGIDIVSEEWADKKIAKLRAEKERAEAERDEAIRMRDRHAEASKAQNEDITALMAERDAALKDAERWKWSRYNGVLKRGKPMDTYFIYNDEADAYADAAIAARKGQQ